MDRSVYFCTSCFDMPAFFDSSLVKCQFACWMVVKGTDLINHPSQGNVGEEVLSGAFVMKSSANITVIAGKPDFFDIRVFMLLFKQEESRFKF